MIVSAQCDLRYATLADLEVQNAATAADWLSDEELALWRRFRAAMRKDTFLAGRILAKRLLQAQHCAAALSRPAQITIRSNDPGSSGVRPRIMFGGHRLAYSLSISHTGDAVLVGGTNRFGVSVGVDLVRMRSLGAAFERSWLTDAEAAFLKQNRDDMSVADIWAMKEAVYKAVHRGESFAPRSVVILLEPEGTTVHYHGRNLRERCHVRIWRLGGQVAAVAMYQRLGARPRPHYENHRPQPQVIPTS
jgi:phosphopantetheinyl transferase